MALKNFLIGSPLNPRKEQQERLPKTIGLALLSSDALSSVAYATEEILIALLLGGMAFLSASLPIAICISILIAIVITSYYQTIYAYPTGGGAYTVSKENLGQNAALVAGASLMIDYILTVTVSIAAGVAALTSAFPILYPHRVLLCLLCLIILTIVNLRGVRETGKFFCFPVYAFIVSLAIMLLIGFWQSSVSPHSLPIPSSLDPTHSLGPWSLLILIRAFATGCVALTGIETVANGTKIFRSPEARNANITLIWMGVLLGVLFLAITYLADFHGILPKPNETVLSQVTTAALGKGFWYYFIQIATYAILLLAANSAFAGFPRLSCVIAIDGFLPKQLSTRGDRLVYSNGILLLGFFAALLLLVFRAETTRLIPLYTIGVFSAFTFSQAGMVKHWLKTKKKGWLRGVAINGTGAAVTALVLLIVAIGKFTGGAWIVLIATPIIVFTMRKISNHYKYVDRQLAIQPQEPYASVFTENIIVIPVSGVQKSILNAVNYAKLLSKKIWPVYVDLDMGSVEEMSSNWKKHIPDVPLTILESPNRSLIQPLMQYIDELQVKHPTAIITVIMPAFVPNRGWQHLLHNQRGILLKTLFTLKRNVVFMNVPLHLE